MVVLLPPPGAGHWEIFSVCCMHWSTAIIQGTLCSLNVSGYNLRVNRQRCTCTLVPPLNNGDNAAPASAQALVLAVVRLQAIGNRVFAIRYITWDKWELPSAITTLGTIRPENSGAVFCIAKPKSPTV